MAPGAPSRCAVKTQKPASGDSADRLAHARCLLWIGGELVGYHRANGAEAAVRSERDILRLQVFQREAQAVAVLVRLLDQRLREAHLVGVDLLGSQRGQDAAEVVLQHLLGDLHDALGERGESRKLPEGLTLFRCTGSIL